MTMDAARVHAANRTFAMARGRLVEILGYVDRKVHGRYGYARGYEGADRREVGFRCRVWNKTRRCWQRTEWVVADEGIDGLVSTMDAEGIMRRQLVGW